MWITTWTIRLHKSRVYNQQHTAYYMECEFRTNNLQLLLSMLHFLYWALLCFSTQTHTHTHKGKRKKVRLVGIHLLIKCNYPPHYKAWDSSLTLYILLIIWLTSVSEWEKHLINISLSFLFLNRAYSHRVFIILTPSLWFDERINQVQPVSLLEASLMRILTLDCKKMLQLNPIH